MVVRSETEVDGKARGERRRLPAFPVRAEPATGPITCWGVTDIDGDLADLLAAGALPHTPVRDVGDGIRVATVREPGRNVLGIIANPHFTTDAVTATAAPTSDR